MPEITYNYDKTDEFIKYENEAELPRIIKIFIKELRSKFPNDEITLDQYNESKELESGEIFRDLDLEIEIDAEKNAKGEYAELKKSDSRFELLADALGIDRWYIHTIQKNKEEFAKKFLKDFKKYMKSTEFGGNIHSIQFNLNARRNMEIKIIIKRDNWGRNNSNIRVAAKEYLDSLGYSNIAVYIP